MYEKKGMEIKMLLKITFLTLTVAVLADSRNGNGRYEIQNNPDREVERRGSDVDFLNRSVRDVQDNYNLKTMSNQQFVNATDSDANPDLRKRFFKLKGLKSKVRKIKTGSKKRTSHGKKVRKTNHKAKSSHKRQKKTQNKKDTHTGKVEIELNLNSIPEDTDDEEDGWRRKDGGDKRTNVTFTGLNKKSVFNGDRCPTGKVRYGSECVDEY